jgi:DNA-binding response OmpR family regulator
MNTTSERRILIVDDTEEVRLLVDHALSEAAFRTRCVESATEALRELQAFQPHLVILDVMLPDATGLEICREIQASSHIPVILLTSRDAESDVLMGLAAGADDYLTKPFSHRELVARVQTLLRRRLPIGEYLAKSVAASTRSHGSLTLDMESRDAQVQGQSVPLTRLEFDLVAALMSRPRMVFSRRQLIEMVWGMNWHGDEHVVDVHLSNARKKIGDELFLAVRGVGYRMADLREPSIH